jgi:hypothetical protein
MCHYDDRDERGEEHDLEMEAQAAAYYRVHPGYRRAARRLGRAEADLAAAAADFYRAQERSHGPPRRRPDGPHERDSETRAFNPYEPIPGEWSAHPPDTAPVGGPPPRDRETGDPAAYYQARWQRGPGFRGGRRFRGGHGFFGPWLLIALLILLAVHSPLLGAVLVPIASLVAFWPLLLLGGAFLFLRRRSGLGRW